MCDGSAYEVILASLVRFVSSLFGGRLTFIQSELLRGEMKYRAAEPQPCGEEHLLVMPVGSLLQFLHPCPEVLRSLSRLAALLVAPACRPF